MLHVNWLHYELRLLMVSNPQTELRNIAAVLAQVTEFYMNLARLEIRLTRVLYFPPENTKELAAPIQAIRNSVRLLTLERLYRV